jgi:CRP-like cAMP-binding protein
MKEIDEVQFLNLVHEIIPFRYLNSGQKDWLLKRSRCLTFDLDDVIARQGNPRDNRVFLLAEGSVETIDNKHGARRRINRIEAGHYFGERAALFQRPRSVEFKALSPGFCFWFSGKTFIRLLKRSRAFAQGFGSILRDRQGIFGAFESFQADISKGIARGYIPLRILTRKYAQLRPALHPFLDQDVIDTRALLYAVRRLPANVTSTLVYLLTDEMPSGFPDTKNLFLEIPTQARRRDVWELLPGKDMVLMRFGSSDAVDLLTCLCLFLIESKKIRSRLNDPSYFKELHEFLQRNSQENRTESAERAFLQGFPFSREEIDGLQDIWPGKVVERLLDILRLREAVSCDVRKQYNNYNSRRSELWTTQIGYGTRRLLGRDPGDLPEGMRVHIISSNSHSVTNCLSPPIFEEAENILKFADEQGIPDYHNPTDRIFAALRNYGKIEFGDELEYGLLRLPAAASTGIEVQLIHLEKLRGKKIDPALSDPPPNTLIVNIDYAFGEQAEDILRNLIMLFGEHIVSINVLGKAGALLGSRGDVLVPTSFINQDNDHFYRPKLHQRSSLSRLRRFIPNRGIHRGPMLTVMGTLLQNRRMLNFYRHIWNCIGLEMEGAFYFRQIQESVEMKLLRKDLSCRFLYYVSDKPLDHASNLGASMGMQEGLPPLYGITREILSGIFEDRGE